MPHCDAIADGDGIELEWYAAAGSNGFFDPLRHLIEVHMAWHNLAEAVGYADERLADVGIFQACGPQ
jgi:hypothetical protein